jgi:hypothetical protein
MAEVGELGRKQGVSFGDLTGLDRSSLSYINTFHQLRELAGDVFIDPSRLKKVT